MTEEEIRHERGMALAFLDGLTDLRPISGPSLELVSSAAHEMLYVLDRAAELDDAIAIEQWFDAGDDGDEIADCLAALEERRTTIEALIALADVLHDVSAINQLRRRLRRAIR